MLLRFLAYAALVVVPVDLGAAAWIAFQGETLGLGLAERVLGAFVLVHLGWFVLALGMLGIYVARVYKDTMGLPLYVVDEKQSSRRALPGE